MLELLLLYYYYSTTTLLLIYNESRLFLQYGDIMSMMIDAVPEHNPKDVVDYFYRSLNYSIPSLFIFLTHLTITPTRNNSPSLTHLLTDTY